MSFQLTSTAIKEGQPIPELYTGDGQDVSPPLAWSGAPPGTKTYTMICDDPDAPRGTFTHWVAFNLPSAQQVLSEGTPTHVTLPDGGGQGTNDFGRTGYGGPAPPPGKPHRYFFRLYAVDDVLPLKAGATKPQVLSALKGHILGEALLMGTYGRTAK
jgi:Raf kinase inhibitor-like YbhB/YbcL family protein